jgi:hypothetical protein
MKEASNVVKFKVTNLHSYFAENVFAVFFLSVPTEPPMLTVSDTTPNQQSLQMLDKSSEIAFVCQLFCSRMNDDNQSVSQFLGSFAVDMSQCRPKKYTFDVHDASTRPPVCTGQVSIEFNCPAPASMLSAPLTVHTMQNNTHVQLAEASEANLTWIQGFGKNGLMSIVEGLDRVHSPYYTNHLGTTMPSGAFCLIPTCLGCHKEAALRTHKEQLQVALARNVISENTFVDNISDMLTSGNVKSKHLRCLVAISDAVTMHAQVSINYTPDVRLTPTPVGTERWEIPREPTADGGSSFTGDCEDFAREVYQQCKEIVKWVQPGTADILSAMSAVLHLYVPTIEQGAVDSSAHSKYITYDAPYRNHIWAALHPRDAWRSKLLVHNCSLTTLYEKWPKVACESKLPLLHLEGTGQVYPVVTNRNPGYVVKMHRLVQQLHCPQLDSATTPDMSLQCEHSSTFYKYAIACMTDVFADQGFLDFTYITNNTYGCSIYEWARGNYHFVPSTKHSKDTMNTIKQLIKLERPIFPITERSSIQQRPRIDNGYYVRFGQETAFDNIPKEALTGEYTIGSHKWYEIYFRIDRNVQETD